MAQKVNSNLLYLDGLRALAAIYVMLYHAVLQYYTSTTTLKGLKLITVAALLYGRLQWIYLSYSLDFV